jgi:hypothetical protein
VVGEVVKGGPPIAPPSPDGARGADDLYDAITAAERERDEAREALVALREAALACAALSGLPQIVGAEQYDALDAALAATPSTLAGQVKARVLREAADRMDAHGQDLVWDAFFREGFAEQVTAWLRALADEAEKKI